jgi:aldehyde dehydrogenase (NAD+)
MTNIDLLPFSSELDQVHSRMRLALDRNPRNYHWRMEQLRALKRMLEENDEAICEAMWKDLRKSKFECAATEQGVVLGEITLTLKKLKRWMKPKRVSTPLYNQPGRSRIVHEPYGLALIIGAWNYPINLTLAPLVGAIAGGNAAIIKPSEISAQTAKVLGDLIPKYLDPDLFAVVQGGADETGVLLDKQFDTIFFTGSGPVGKIILAKAASHLTPVTLELGGKSPAVVLSDADIEVAARRIAWGKFMNAGQTCVAPDYLIVHPAIREHLISAIKSCLREFFGERAEQSPDYCRIINSKNFDRLAKLKEGLSVLHGGASDRATLYIEPTILSAKPESAIMQDEIFGPLLPVLELSDVQEICKFIKARPKPLALYVFTKDDAVVERFANSTSSGALCINDVVIHMPMPELPFGGVGASGMGHYHGEFSFKTFTHAKGILKKSNWFDVPVRYAPYTSLKAKILRWLFK